MLGTRFRGVLPRFLGRHTPGGWCLSSLAPSSLCRWWYGEAPRERQDTAFKTQLAHWHPLLEGETVALLGRAQAVSRPRFPLWSSSFAQLVTPAGPFTTPPHSHKNHCPSFVLWSPADPWEHGHLPPSQLSAGLDGRGSPAAPKDAGPHSLCTPDRDCLGHGHGRSLAGSQRAPSPASRGLGLMGQPIQDLSGLKWQPCATTPGPCVSVRLPPVPAERGKGCDSDEARSVSH